MKRHKVFRAWFLQIKQSACFFSSPPSPALSLSIYIYMCVCVCVVWIRIMVIVYLLFFSSTDAALIDEISWLKYLILAVDLGDCSLQASGEARCWPTLGFIHLISHPPCWIPSFPMLYARMVYMIISPHLWICYPVTNQVRIIEW